MSRQREAARRAAAEKLARAKAAQEAAAREHARQAAEEVIPWLRALGFRGEQARYAAERCEAIPDASLEDRVKAALSCLAPSAAMRAAAPA